MFSPCKALACCMLASGMAACTLGEFAERSSSFVLRVMCGYTALQPTAGYVAARYGSRSRSKSAE